MLFQDGPVRGIGIAQDGNKLDVFCVVEEGGPFFALPSLGWEDLATKLPSAPGAVVLIEALPNLDRARAFASEGPNRLVVTYGTVPEGHAYENKDDGSIVVRRQARPTRAAFELAELACRLATESAPRPPGVAAVVTLAPRASRSMMAEYAAPEQVACRVDQPLVFEGPFLRTYDGETGDIAYQPTGRIERITVERATA